SQEGTDVVVGVWKDGRIGTFRGIRSGKGGYGGTAFSDKGTNQLAGFSGYVPLIVEIAEFFRTGEPPVTKEETIAIYAFMEAADESKRRGGVPVSIQEVLEQARNAPSSK
ncbi:MAG: gfo/Idh/MocA family oxidoreductase, partial [Planctomycetaceae bacterium]|nr:gfo/Idh/MocA family oxidoreductase [Planctomycetaceae bacterium]